MKKVPRQRERIGRLASDELLDRGNLDSDSLGAKSKNLLPPVPSLSAHQLCVLDQNSLLQPSHAISGDQPEFAAVLQEHVPAGLARVDADAVCVSWARGVRRGSASV